MPKIVFMVANSVSPHTLYWKICSILLTILQKQNTAKCYASSCNERIIFKNIQEIKQRLNFILLQILWIREQIIVMTIKCIDFFLFHVLKQFSYLAYIDLSFLNFREAIETSENKTSLSEVHATDDISHFLSSLIFENRCLTSVFINVTSKRLILNLVCYIFINIEKCSGSYEGNNLEVIFLQKKRWWIT